MGKRRWIVAIAGIVAIAAVACSSAVDEDTPAPAEPQAGAPPISASVVGSNEPPISSAPITAQPPVDEPQKPDVISPGGPITSIDDINPDFCNFIHNINACFVDGQLPEGIPLGGLWGVYFIARNDLSAQFGVPQATVKIKNAERVEWNDSSLGLPQPGVNYAQVITPGFKLTLQDGAGKTYLYHTSLEEAILAEPGLGEPTRPVTSEPPVQSGPITSIDDINPDECNFIHNINACFVDGQPPEGIPLGEYTNVYFLAREDLGAGTVKIKSVEKVDWNDSSLGAPEEGMVYLQVITPGFKLVLEVEGDLYTYHTSNDRVVFVEGLIIPR